MRESLRFESMEARLHRRVVRDAQAGAAVSIWTKVEYAIEWCIRECTEWPGSEAQRNAAVNAGTSAKEAREAIETLEREHAALRAELANHRRQLPDALENAEDHGAEKERAAIVAWLRDPIRVGESGSWDALVVQAIERGEHVK